MKEGALGGMRESAMAARDSALAARENAMAARERKSASFEEARTTSWKKPNENIIQ